MDSRLSSMFSPEEHSGCKNSERVPCRFVFGPHCYEPIVDQCLQLIVGLGQSAGYSTLV